MFQFISFLVLVFALIQPLQALGQSTLGDGHYAILSNKAAHPNAGKAIFSW